MSGIITGLICLLCFCLLLAKALTRKYGLRRADRLFMKLHKPASGLLLLGCAAHMILVFPVLRMRHVIVLITGVCAVLCYLLLIVFCHRGGPRLLSAKHEENPAAYKLRLHRIMSVIMLCLITVHILFYYIDYAQYGQRIAAVSLHGIDTSRIPDGTYTGAYDAGYIYAQVSVTVADGAVTEIRLLEHRHQRGAAAEQIIPDIIASQRTDTDAISGATNSSLVIEKAVENALENASESKSENALENASEKGTL